MRTNGQTDGRAGRAGRASERRPHYVPQRNRNIERVRINFAPFWGGCCSTRMKDVQIYRVSLWLSRYGMMPDSVQKKNIIPYFAVGTIPTQSPTARCVVVRPDCHHYYFRKRQQVWLYKMPPSEDELREVVRGESIA